MKVLVSAYTCNPYEGSEHAVGWGFVSALASKYELHVITESRHETSIRQYYASRPDLTPPTFHYVKRRWVVWREKLWPPSYYWTYKEWQWAAYQLACNLHKQHRFALVHQLTMVGFREPGYLWKLPVPFVWGPVGGMGYVPWRMLMAMGPRGALYYLAYNVINYVHARTLARPRLAAASAGVGLICATKENASATLRNWGARGSVICEVGLPDVEQKCSVPRISGEPLRIVWSGNHNPGKALNLVIAALSMVTRKEQFVLHVLGSGSMTDVWRRKAKQLDVESRCIFYGRLPRKEALEVMARGHVAVISSLRDLTSTVTIEALAAAMPVICLDHCGFADVIDETCGIKVPVTTPDGVVTGLRDALISLEEDEPKRMKLSEGALLKAREYRWEYKADLMSKIYEARVARSA